MKKNKKILTFMVAVSLCAVQFACPMSITGFAAEQTVYTGVCGAEGDNITWTYDADTQTMIFSGSGAMNDFLDGEEIPWRSGELSNIYDAKNIIYEEGITDVCNFQVSMNGEKEEHYDITFPESAAVPRMYVPRWGYHLTYHVKYGSKAYYTLHHISKKSFKNCDIVAEGVAENEVIPTEGETETGLRWKFDYETATLTLSGTDGEMILVSDELGHYTPQLNSSLILGKSDVLDLWCAADKIVIEQDFVIPDSTEVMETIRKEHGDNSIFEHEYIYYTVTLLGNYNDQTIYCYKGSQFAQEYEAYKAMYIGEPWANGCEVVYMDDTENAAEDIVEVGDNGVISCGDLNMDGKVDLTDVIYLNKYTANILQLTDAQKVVADCNGDGSVTDDDVTTVMEYLMFQIPSLPYQA